MNNLKDKATQDVKDMAEEQILRVKSDINNQETQFLKVFNEQLENLKKENVAVLTEGVVRKQENTVRTI